MEEEEGAQETPFDLVVEANSALWIAEWVKKMSKSIWSWERSFDRASLAAVASIIDGSWNVGPDRVADHAEDYMASGKPNSHEETEEDVTDSGAAHVLETFGQL